MSEIDDKPIIQGEAQTADPYQQTAEALKADLVSRPDISGSLTPLALNHVEDSVNATSSEREQQEESAKHPELTQEFEAELSKRLTLPFVLKAIDKKLRSFRLKEAKPGRDGSKKSPPITIGGVPQTAPTDKIREYSETDIEEFQQRVFRVADALKAAFRSKKYSDIPTDTEISPDEYVKTVLTAIEQKTQQAIALKDEDSELAKQAIETILLLDSLIQLGSQGHVISNATRDSVIRLVRNGQSYQVLEAGKAVSDVLYSTGSSLVPVKREGLYVPNDDESQEYESKDKYNNPSRVTRELGNLLQLASSIDTGSKDQESLFDKLQSDELAALAYLYKFEKHDYPTSARLSLLALERLPESCDNRSYKKAQRNARIIEESFDLIREAPEGINNDEENIELDRALRRLLIRRNPGMTHNRGMNPIHEHLDTVLSALMLDDRYDIARELISGSSEDGIYIDSELIEKKVIEEDSSLKSNHLLKTIAINEKRREIVDNYSKIQKEKFIKLLESLNLDSEFDEEHINFIIQSSWAPEAFLDIDLKKRKLINSIQDPRILERFFSDPSWIYANVDILAKIDALNIFDVDTYEEIQTRLLEFNEKSHINPQDKESLAQETTEVFDLFDEIQKHNNSNPEDIIIINSGDIEKFIDIVYKFKSPKELIGMYESLKSALAGKVNIGIFELSELFTELPNKQRYKIGKDSVDIDDIIFIYENMSDYLDPATLKVVMSGKIDSLEKIKYLRSIDYESLKDAVEIINNASGDSSEILDPDFSQLMERCIYNMELNEFLQSFVASNPEYIKAVLSITGIKKGLKGKLLDTRIMYGNDPEELASSQSKIIPLLQGPLGDFLKNEEYSLELREYLLDVLLRDENPQKVMENLNDATEIFGGQLNEEVLDVVNKIGSAKSIDYIPQELQELGISKVGKAGIQQLKTRLERFQREIYLQGEIPVETVLKNPFLIRYLKLITRFNESQWGSHRNEWLMQLLVRVQEGQEKRNIDPRLAVEDIEIKTKDKEKMDSFVIDKDAIEEWQKYKNIVQRATQIVPSRGSIDGIKLVELFTDIQSDISSRQQAIADGISKIQTKINELSNTGKDSPKLQQQVDNQQKSLDSLAAIDFGNVEELDIFKLTQILHELGSNKSIVKSGLIQTLLIATALWKARADGNNLSELFENMPEEPSLESLGRMADLIGHIVNQETWRELYGTIGGEKQLNEILSTDAMMAAIRKSETIESSGTRSFRIIPTRGVLMELSGHIGDACWAEKYDIAESYPNMTCIVLVQNPDTVHQRLVGSAMLIETLSASGEPLLILRGLNPIENAINQLNVEDFTDQIFAYVIEMAKKLDRVPAVVIDDHCGGSATNRPELYIQLASRKASMRNIPLASEEGTTFNGYNITECTYLIPDISETKASPSGLLT